MSKYLREYVQAFRRLIHASLLPKSTIYSNRMAARVMVRNLDSEDRIQITFKYPSVADPQLDKNLTKQRVFNFDRLKSEELEKTLVRISTNVSKVANKKGKKRKSEAETDQTATDDINVHLLTTEGAGNRQISGDQTNAVAWQNGMKLCIGDQEYEVQLNVPTIKHLSLPDVLISSFSVTPKVEVEFCSAENCNYVWFKQYAKDQTSSCNNTHKKKENKDSAVAVEVSEVVNSENMDETSLKSKGAKFNCESGATMNSNDSWIQIHHGRIYTPSESDISCNLRLDCLPQNSSTEGEATSAVSKHPVVPREEYYPFEKRQIHTAQEAGPGRFRMMSYNILADIYADSDFTRDFLFPYCPEHALSIDYRKTLLLKEIQGYRSDVICLQEVDKKVFDNDLQPELSEAGFTGLLRPKAGEVAEGSATFFRNSKFRFVSSHDIALSEALFGDSLYSDLKEKVSKSEILLEKMTTRSSCLQVTVLQCLADTKRHLLVATVHLYFHPKASHVRIIHTAVCMRHIEKILSVYEEQGIRPDVIFCGDLNSWPRSGLHEFLTTKRVSGKHSDWYSCGKPEYVAGMDLSHNLEVVSACGTPHYTNYVSGFNECLDYIYHEPARTRVASVVPLPSHEEVTQHTALPSIVFPSDHIALVCDLEWIC